MVIAVRQSILLLVSQSLVNGIAKNLAELR